jgi:hypothetical protein
MGKHKTLVDAKRNKKDEFYTQLEDIQNECKNYKKHYEGAVICCPCDESEHTKFHQFFMDNMEVFNWKKLICVGYSKVSNAEAHIVENNDGDIKRWNKKLIGNGDFRNKDTIDLIAESDVVVTNPPFSLWREFISMLTDMNKKFLIVGPQTVISNKDVFPLIKENKLWAGHTFNKTMEFQVPDDYKYDRVDVDGKKYGNVPGTCFFTNLDTVKRSVRFDTGIDMAWAEKKGWVRKYDNYDAINVDQVNHIPMDYDGFIGVPVTFLKHHNPEQFEIVGLAAGNSKACGFHYEVPYTPHPDDRGGCGVIDGKRIYSRLFIRRKK